MFCCICQRKDKDAATTSISSTTGGKTSNGELKRAADSSSDDSSADSSKKTKTDEKDGKNYHTLECIHCFDGASIAYATAVLEVPVSISGSDQMLLRSENIISEFGVLFYVYIYKKERIYVFISVV